MVLSKCGDDFLKFSISNILFFLDLVLIDEHCGCLQMLTPHLHKNGALRLVRSHTEHRGNALVGPDLPDICKDWALQWAFYFVLLSNS